MAALHAKYTKLLWLGTTATTTHESQRSGGEGDSQVVADPLKRRDFEMAYQDMLDCGFSDGEAILIIDRLIDLEDLGPWVRPPVEAELFQAFVDEDNLIFLPL